MGSGGRLSGDLAEALSRCTGTSATGHSLPAACYVDPDVAALEAEVIFRQGWVGVGRSDRWPGTGDYAAIDLGGVPVVVVRDDEGALKAYANTCRHRSTQVMDGEGHCTRMRCPFHFWTYGLDGRLLGAPNMHQTEDFDRDEHGLHEFAVTERHGFAFVSL